jgi:hypothetical protein
MGEWSFKEMFLFNNTQSGSNYLTFHLSISQLSTFTTPNNSTC